MAQKRYNPPKRGATKSRKIGKKKSGAGKRFGVAVLVILLVAALAALGVGAAYEFTDGFGTKTLNVFVVKCGEHTYTKNIGGLVVQPGMEFTVEKLAGETDYAVTIRAKGTEGNNFGFRLGAESGYHWKDQDGRDYTEGFTITRTETSFTLDFGTLTEIIAKAKGTDATLTNEASAGDLFTLVVTCGKSEIALDFRTEIPVTGVELDPPAIIIDSNDVQPGENVLLEANGEEETEQEGESDLPEETGEKEDE